MVEAFGGARQKQGVTRRQKHDINRDMIHDALDQVGVDNIPASEPATPKANGELSLAPEAWFYSRS